MVAVDLLVKAGEWGAKVLAASETKAQKRSADVVEKCAILVAGLRHMDTRFTDLFVPLVFYDPGSWPIERRRTWAEDALGFIHGDRVVDRLGQGITYLEATSIDDPQLAALVQDLCDITHVALWGALVVDVEFPAVTADSRSPTKELGWTWADNSRYWGHAIRGGGTVGGRQALDPDAIVAPAVAALVALMRTEDPDPSEVCLSASACLVKPERLGPRDAVPPAMYGHLVREDSEHSPVWMSPANSFDLAAGFEPQRPGWTDEPGGEAWPPPLNTVSPLRDFADNAGRRFQQILAVVRASFPGLPEPSWLWENPT